MRDTYVPVTAWGGLSTAEYLGSSYIIPEERRGTGSTAGTTHTNTATRHIEYSGAHIRGSTPAAQEVSLNICTEIHPDTRKKATKSLDCFKKNGLFIIWNIWQSFGVDRNTPPSTNSTSVERASKYKPLKLLILQEN